MLLKKRRKKALSSNFAASFKIKMRCFITNTIQVVLRMQPFPANTYLCIKFAIDEKIDSYIVLFGCDSFAICS